MAKKIAPPRRSSRRDDGHAFIPDPVESGVFIVADEAESLAEEFIAGVTSAEHLGEDARDEMALYELGGPFLTEDAPIDDADEPT